MVTGLSAFNWIRSRSSTTLVCGPEKLSRMVLALLAFLIVAPQQPQAGTIQSASAASAEVATPEDPKGRVKLAAKVNGLAGIKSPWHLKAHYEVFAANGSISERGSYEEWRVSEKRYRIALHNPSLSVEEYGTDHGIFRTGGREWPRGALASITGVIARPIWPPLPEDAVYENVQRNLGGKEFPCTAVKGTPGRITPANSTTFCFSHNSPILLYAATPGPAKQTLFNQVKSLHGAYLAFEIEQIVDGTPWLKLHVDLLESLPPASLSALTVPADALEVTPRVRPGEHDPGDSMTDARRILHKTTAIYPEHAKSRGIKGTVVLDALVDKDGHVASLHVIAGPQLLQQPALDAVKTWTYQPYKLDGQPAEVETVIDVVFPAGDD